MLFEVIVKNEMLGDSSQIMSLERIKKFNICAFRCAKYVEKYGGEVTYGMWTVRAAQQTTPADGESDPAAE
jgi:hypothetical protein